MPEIYECKSTTQDRPYVSRPSRTQQLTNPKLVPKLTTDVPNELLRKKGIADEELAKKEAERGRQRKADEDDSSGRGKKRSRSVSTSSSTSVSTISTNLSRSPSPRRSLPATTMRDRHSHNGLRDSKAYPRRSSSSSSAKSYTSSSSLGRRRGYPSQDQVKGIERQELPQPVKNFETDFTHRANLKRRRSSQSSSRSYSSNSSTDWRRRRPSREGDRNTRRRRSSISPDRRGRDRSIPGMRHRRRSQTRSRDRSQIARNRQSMTPASPQHRGLGIGRASQWKARHQSREAGPAAEYDDTKSHWTAASDSRGKGTSHSSRRSPPTRKDRSLSPFSKRLALTQAMNMGVR
ncbi:MAG: hypothetical protein Q9191_006108 [Dirinaria sp. TL-2023a]